MEKSKIYLAPINTGFFDNGHFLDHIYTFHGNRSGKGIGISYLGNVAVEKNFVTNNNTAYISEANLAEFAKIAKIIHNNGSRAGIQLAARSDPMPALKTWNGHARDEYIHYMRNFFANKVSETEYIVNSFISNAKVVIDCGFSVVQIHAAHGYFLSNWLSPTLNPHFEDPYIGGIAIVNRMIQGIKDHSKDIEVDLRYSITDPVDVDKTEVIKMIMSGQLDIMSFSAGIYDINKTQVYPNASLGQLPYFEIAKPYLYNTVEINLAGNIYDIGALSYEGNVSYSIGRNLIANPSFLVSQDPKCQCRNKCHYYSRGKKHIECPVSLDINFK